MKQKKILDDNYFVIHGWMLNRLHLKGIALEVFAIVYGFSQDGESEFTGSVQYLCEFTGTSKPTVIKALKCLTEQNYILKNEIEINGVKFNRYKANLQVVKNFNYGSKETLPDGSKETLQGSKETLPDGSKETLPNKEVIDIKDNNKGLDKDIKYIIDHLNSLANTDYRSTTKETVKLLTGILTGETPYSVEDCITVINKMCAKWKGTEWEEYLRPRTLFGNKFESYLNQKVYIKKQEDAGTGNIFLDMYNEEHERRESF